MSEQLWTMDKDAPIPRRYIPVSYLPQRRAEWSHSGAAVPRPQDPHRQRIPADSPSQLCWIGRAELRRSECHHSGCPGLVVGIGTELGKMRRDRQHFSRRVIQVDGAIWSNARIWRWSTHGSINPVPVIEAGTGTPYLIDRR